MSAEHADPGLGVYFLDVGQGDCTFIVPPTGAPILFDCSDSYVAERFVANHGITDLAAVVASHLDIDHVRGILPFLRQHFAAGRRVERLVLFPDRVPPKAMNSALRELVHQASRWERNPPHDGFVLKGTHRDGDGPLLLAQEPGDWSVELVLPWIGAAAASLIRGSQPNTASAVLRVVRGSTAVLIGGDAPLGSWERLEPGRRAARAIRVSHHGGEIREGGQDWTRFEDLYDAIDADLAVISVGTNNPHGHPFPDHLGAAHRGGSCRLLCTQLTRRCHPDPLAVRTEALTFTSGVEWPYRHRVMPGHPSRNRPPAEVPCAGSVVARLSVEGRLTVEPDSPGDHDLLLGRLPGRLCAT